MNSTVQALVWQDNVLKLLDQRALPAQESWIECRNAKDVATAITEMVVRGAPAIGIAAAYGLALEAGAGGDMIAAHKVLAQSRPTAVNLHWALARMSEKGGDSFESLLAQAKCIHQEDLQQNLRMAELGAQLIDKGSRVLTHCNTGALATGGHGTALGVIRTAWAQGRIEQVYNTETRPWLQGARLTAWELQREGIPGKLIADSAAAHLMKTEKIDWVIVGADRIAANGDTANKIGTYALAIAARHHGAKFMVVAPSGTFDLACPNGDAIPIEMRDDSELTTIQNCAVAASGTKTWNPVFDVTPWQFADAIVSERKIFLPSPEGGFRF